MEKSQQLKVIKFLKGEFYQKVLKKYSNIYENAMLKFETLYLGENTGYNSHDAIYSELSLQAQKVKIFLSKIEDITDDSEGALLTKELLLGQVNNLKTHLFNSVTNGMGLSKDTAMYTSDDMEKFKMLFEKEFHLFIITLMNPTSDGIGLSVQEKYDIYENPEDQI